MSTIFDSRKEYFSDLGTTISGCQKSEQAIKLAGLDFEVEKQNIFLADGTVVPDKFANVRTDTNQILGVVGSNYNVVQNREGFEFLDDIIGTDCVYETAGSLNGSKISYMLAKTEPIKIMGDEFDPYILFTNSFDGSGTVKALFTPIRVVCKNTLELAIKKATNKISIRHSSSVKDRLQIAKETLLQNSLYIQHFKEVSEQLAVTKFTKEDAEAAIEKLMPIDLSKTDGRIEKLEEERNVFWRAYNQDDLQNFNDTAYKFLQAIADYDSHKLPGRNTNNPAYAMLRVIAGMALLNKAFEHIQARMQIVF